MNSKTDKRRIAILATGGLAVIMGLGVAPWYVTVTVGSGVFSAVPNLRIYRVAAPNPSKNEGQHEERRRPCLSCPVDMSGNDRAGIGKGNNKVSGRAAPKYPSFVLFPRQIQKVLAFPHLLDLVGDFLKIIPDHPLTYAEAINEFAPDFNEDPGRNLFPGFSRLESVLYILLAIF